MTQRMRAKRHQAGSQTRGLGRPYLAFAVGLLATLGWPTTAAATPPGVQGNRTLGLGLGGRSSATGANALIANPAGMSMTPELVIDTMYQYRLEDRGHGFALAAMDSRLSSRVSAGLTYAMMLAKPRVDYVGMDGNAEQLDLTHTGHEVGLGLSVAIVKRWLSIALKPKYQFTSLRFVGSDGQTYPANQTHSAFGLDAAAQLTILGLVGVAVIGENLAGTHPPAWTDNRDPTLTSIDYTSLDTSGLRRLSDYPRTLIHSVSVFPTRKPGFNINFDGAYDFTSFRELDDPYTRLRYGGSAEYTLGPVPLRFGGFWDGRGRGKEDDRGYIAGGVAFSKPADLGGVGLDIGFSFQRQVTGPNPETFIGVNLALRLNPNR